jgi:purine-nucleoside phosphorylase
MSCSRDGSICFILQCTILAKTAATILTVSDIIPTHEKISADEREKALLPMMNLALESVTKI